MLNFSLILANLLIPVKVPVELNNLHIFCACDSGTEKPSHGLRPQQQLSMDIVCKACYEDLVTQRRRSSSHFSVSVLLDIFSTFLPFLKSA